MPGKRINFSTIIATLTPLNANIDPIQYQSDSTWDEETFLEEPQFEKDLGKQFMDVSGDNATTIHRFAANGTRDGQLFDDAPMEQMVSWAQRRPPIHFNFDFRYQLEEQDETDVKIQRHFDCFFTKIPFRAISNEIAVIKFSIRFAKIRLINAATGLEV